jgi:ribosome recycling factor
MDDLMQETLLEFEDRADKSIAHLAETLAGIRTGRASPALVEHIKVPAYGTSTPLNQLAHVSVPEARQLVVKPFDPSILKDIERALLTSDLGLTPSSDGKLLRLTLPPLSEEQRKKLAVRVKDFAEQTRVALRNERRDANKKAEHALKAHQITEDLNREIHDAIQESLKGHEKKIDEILARKTQEIMED